MKSLYLIDGHSMAYRAFYAIPSLSNSKGKPTNAIYGFIRMLAAILKEEKPTHLVVCFDSPAKTFRHQIFPEYKAQRQRMPDVMRSQMEAIFEIIPALGVLSVAVSGFEADDIIATLSTKFKADMDEIVILTQDKDILQLVDEKVRVASPKKGLSEKVVYDREAVKARFGVYPERIADYLTIVGDTSDNLPGIKGVGPKAAVTLINTFGGLDDILQNIAKIGNPRVVKALQEAKEIETKKRLVVLSSDIPLEYSLADIEVQEPDKERLLNIFLGHEFGSLIKEFGLKKEEAVNLSAFSELKFFDVQIASYLLNPGLKHNLEDIVIRYLPGADLGPKTALLLKEKLEQKMKDEGLLSLFYEIEMPLIEVLAGMEKEGIGVDKEHLSSFGKELEERIASLSKEIYEGAGEPFNLNSPKQLSAILFEKLGLPPVQQIKTGYSTNEETLVALSGLHPLPRLLLEYRELAKLKSTYVDGLLPLIDAGGRVHTSFNQTITATGRLSSSNPNLQNIPIRSELGKGIRRAFVASSGNLLLSADYSQIELRLLAHLSGDELLIASFLAGEDIHTDTAARIYNIDPVFVTPAMRRQAKAVNFGIVYGMGSYGLAKEIGVSPRDAKEMIDKYFGLYKGVARYIEETKQLAREKGYAETMWGRKRYIPELFSKNRKEKEFGERAAVNMPIQGSAADLIKKAMLTIAKRLPPEAKMLLQVHDELIFEIAENSLEKVAPIIIDSMQNVVNLKVPLTVNISSAKNWGEL